jgi:hypothetical protein
LKKEAVWMINLLKMIRMYSNEDLHHVGLEGRKILEKVFSDGNWSFLIGVILLASYLDRKFLREDCKEKQNVGIHLNREDLKYTRSKVLKFCYFDRSTFSSMSVELSYSELAPSGSQFKSNN